MKVRSKAILSFLAAMTLVGCGDTSIPGKAPVGTAALGGASTGGGDPVALEFKREAQLAIAFVKSSSAFPELDTSRLDATIASSQVYVVEKPIEVDGARPQWPMATNHADPNVITVYRAQWNGLTDSCLKQSMALHEILSLLKVERTGDYRVSERYLPICRAHDQRPLRDAVLHGLYDGLYSDVSFLMPLSMAARPTGSNRSWLSGVALLKQEDERLYAFSRAARAFHELPLRYQLDNLVTGTGAYCVPDPLGNGFACATHGDLSPTTDFLARELYLIVDGVDDTLRIYDEEVGPRLSVAGQKQLHSLVRLSQSIQDLVHDDDSRGRAIVPVTPFTPYLNGAVTELRRRVAQKHCAMPTTFELDPYYQKLAQARLAESVDLPQSDLADLKARAEANDRGLRDALSEIQTGWSALMQSEDLDQFTFPRHPAGAKHVASHMTVLIDISLSVLSQAEDVFVEDVKSLNSMATALDAGELCLNVR